MQKYFNKLIYFIFIFCCFVFFNLKISFAANTSTAKDDEKRILLEAAHGSGYTRNGWDECNHASNTIDGITYYENLEARIMIDKIAGYLKNANIPYEISNEIVGDEYFTDPNWQSSCNPTEKSCCGFKQGTIGEYSKLLYQHIDAIGPDKYLFALELHFNAVDGDQTSNESIVMVKDVKEPFITNGKRITDAVDKVIGTNNSGVRNDYQYLNTNLGAITSLQGERNIPVYYLETFFMDNNEHLKVYLDKKDELAKEIAQALVKIAGSNVEINNNYEDDEEWSGGSTSDPFASYPLLTSSNDFTCKAILVDIKTGELNNLGKLLQDIFSIIKILGPVLAICLSITDFSKVVMSSDLNNTKNKALKRVFKRLAIGIILIFLPYLLDLLLHAFGLYDISRCGIG